jgi:hypothetical protein
MASDSKAFKTEPERESEPSVAVILSFADLILSCSRKELNSSWLLQLLALKRKDMKIKVNI